MSQKFDKSKNKEKITACLKKSIKVPLDIIYYSYYDNGKDRSNILNKIETIGHMKASYFWVFVWTETYKMAEHFHATIVVQFDHQVYLIFNHVEKGDNVVEAKWDSGFPFPIDYQFTKLTKKLWFHWNKGTVGGIACQGPTKPITARDMMNVGLAWWYDVDIANPTEEFPGSCTGLAETIASVVSPEYYTRCPDLHSSRHIFSNTNVFPLTITGVDYDEIRWNLTKSKIKVGGVIRRTSGRIRTKVNRLKPGIELDEQRKEYNRNYRHIGVREDSDSKTNDLPGDANIDVLLGNLMNEDLPFPIIAAPSRNVSRSSGSDRGPIRRQRSRQRVEQKVAQQCPRVCSRPNPPPSCRTCLERAGRRISNLIGWRFSSCSKHKKSRRSIKKSRRRRSIKKSRRRRSIKKSRRRRSIKKSRRRRSIKKSRRRRSVDLKMRYLR
jgi:hypothetical protein